MSTEKDKELKGEFMDTQPGNVVRIKGNEERIAGALTELIVGFFKEEKSNRIKFVREKLEKAIK